MIETSYFRAQEKSFYAKNSTGKTITKFWRILEIFDYKCKYLKSWIQLKNNKEMSQLKNYYEILGIAPDATIIDIEKAYQKLSTQWHPDKHRENRGQAEKMFHDIAEAYDVLSNVNSRSTYDKLFRKQYSLEEANSTFERFFEENGMEDENEIAFFDKHYPNKTRTYYDVLQIPRDASMKDIKKAYRRLALKYHPKNNPGNEEVHNKFVEVNEAYNALSNEMKRENYDNFLYGEMVPSRAHNIFEDFFGNRFFEIEMPTEEEFFKPILNKRWTRNLDSMMEDENSWKDIENGETYKTETVYSNNNGVESKKSVTTKRKIDNGKAQTTTTEEYLFPNGTKEVRKITDKGDGKLETKVYNLKKGENLPIEN